MLNLYLNPRCRLGFYYIAGSLIRKAPGTGSLAAPTLSSNASGFEILELSGLVPVLIGKAGRTRDSLISGFEPFSDILGAPSDMELNAELDVWQDYWLTGRGSEIQPLPDNALATLAVTDCGFYPIIKTALQILATFACSTASAERSFSAMKRLKTYVRSTMTDGRLTGLAHLHVNRGIDVDIPAAVRSFMSKEDRKQLTQASVGVPAPVPAAPGPPAPPNSVPKA